MSVMQDMGARAMALGASSGDSVVVMLPSSSSFLRSR